MKEWTNPYNSFNSYKGLLYRDKFDGMISGNLKAPVEVNIDPCNNCQLDCLWCNAKKIISKDKTVLMTKDHLFDLIDFCADWGVKAICFAGGGEPLMCPYLGEAIERVNNKGMESAIITNGLFSNWKQLNMVSQYTRWCGISVDAATPETYTKVKGVNMFQDVLENIKKLRDLGTREVTYKFLIHPYNQHEIRNACFAARDYGAHGFHSRILSKRYLNGLDYDYNLVKDQLMLAYEYCDNKEFKVYNITHKQDGENNRRMNFDKCKASPLLCMLEANGDVSVCIDRKGDPETRLCSHENINELKETWGSKKHLELLDKIDVNRCPKCTMTVYQELLNAYKKDDFCMNFP